MVRAKTEMDMAVESQIHDARAKDQIPTTYYIDYTEQLIHQDEPQRDQSEGSHEGAMAKRYVKLQTGSATCENTRAWSIYLYRPI